MKQEGHVKKIRKRHTLTFNKEFLREMGGRFIHTCVPIFKCINSIIETSNKSNREAKLEDIKFRKRLKHINANQTFVYLFAQA